MKTSLTPHLNFLVYRLIRQWIDFHISGVIIKHIIKELNKSYILNRKSTHPSEFVKKFPLNWSRTLRIFPLLLWVTKTVTSVIFKWQLSKMNFDFTCYDFTIVWCLFTMIWIWSWIPGTWRVIPHGTPFKLLSEKMNIFEFCLTACKLYSTY